MASGDSTNLVAVVMASICCSETNNVMMERDNNLTWTPHCNYLVGQTDYKSVESPPSLKMQLKKLTNSTNTSDRNSNSWASVEAKQELMARNERPQCVRCRRRRCWPVLWALIAGSTPSALLVEAINLKDGQCDGGHWQVVWRLIRL